MAVTEYPIYGRFPSHSVWKYFDEFLNLDADRFTVLDTILDKVNLEHKIMNIAGNKHLMIEAQPEGERQGHRQTVLIAHYDRCPGSPGANDNSAAVFILMETALELLANKTRDWMIIFTDKEELTSGEGVRNQGAYTLAVDFVKKGKESYRIFNFDACGTGDTLIVSTTVEYLLRNETSIAMEKIHGSIKELQAQALETARELAMEKVLLAPTPFSDDVGFLLAGAAVQTITMLPSNECMILFSKLRREPEFTNVLINLQMRNRGYQKEIPETWRVFNTSGDSYLRLTPQNFKTVRRFAQALCR
ncbi:MAG: M28 family metallopeptidase [Treponema sp.]|nr:M28 family metallopeptidase [Treponema sp.]